MALKFALATTGALVAGCAAQAAPKKTAAATAGSSAPTSAAAKAASAFVLGEWAVTAYRANGSGELTENYSGVLDVTAGRWVFTRDYWPGSDSYQPGSYVKPSGTWSLAGQNLSLTVADPDDALKGSADGMSVVLGGAPADVVPGRVDLSLRTDRDGAGSEPGDLSVAVDTRRVELNYAPPDGTAWRFTAARK